MHLVEGVLLALVEFLAANIHTLLSAQTRVLLLNLRHSSGLERRVGSLESPLGVSLNLGGVALCQ